MTKLLLSLTALATLTAAPAIAGERTARISLAGLDLSRPADAARFERRVAAATEQVCGSYQGTTTDEQDRIAACRKGVTRQVAALKAKDQLARR